MLDVIKPHHVSLCVLLRAFLDSEVLQGLVTSDENYQKLGDFLLQEIRAKSSIKYPSLSELLTKLQDALPSKDVGDQISSLLMEQLGGVQYPDDLVTFFSDMSQLMHSHAQALDEDALKGGADISSAMGFYIRHCCVSFHMLAFEAACGLFDDLQAYKEDDFLAAVDSLYKYFDYSTGQTARPTGGAAGAEPSKGHLQDALLTLGSAHAHFGHVQEALLALNEAVRIAQQHNDNVALAHALSALCHILATASPAAVTQLTEPGAALTDPTAHLSQLLKILKRCEKRAQDLHLPHLFVFARLALAQFALEHQTGPSNQQLAKGSQVAASQATVTDLFTATPPVFGTTFAGSASSADAVEKLAGSSHLLQAEDQALAYAQLAQVAMSKKGYKAAAEVLALADKHLPYSNSPALQAARLGLAHSRALHRRDVRHAALFASQLVGLADPTDSVSKTIIMDAQQAHVRTLLVAGRYDEAAEAARELFESCTEAGLQVQAVELLLLLGQIHEAAGAPLTALPYVLSCLLHSTVLHMDLLAADATCSLSRIWLAMGPAHGPQAVQQLRSVLPTVLGNADTDLQARVQLVLAQALLADATPAHLKADPEEVLQPLQAAAAA
ncbi:hypothetical protein WJX79_009184 [Trebouxia sp. C0005]